MPWSQTSPMDQRTQFIADFLREVQSVTELCALYGVSRKTAYKWIDRYLRQGPAGCQGQPNFPQLCKLNFPHLVQESVVSSARTRPALSFSFRR